MHCFDVKKRVQYAKTRPVAVGYLTVKNGNPAFTLLLLSSLLSEMDVKSFFKSLWLSISGLKVGHTCLCT